MLEQICRKEGKAKTPSHAISITVPSGSLQTSSGSQGPVIRCSTLRMYFREQFPSFSSAMLQLCRSPTRTFPRSRCSFCAWNSNPQFKYHWHTLSIAVKCNHHFSHHVLIPWHAQCSAKGSLLCVGPVIPWEMLERSCKGCNPSSKASLCYLGCWLGRMQHIWGCEDTSWPAAPGTSLLVPP